MDESVDVDDADSSEPRDEDSTVEKTIDGNWNTDPSADSCFYAEAATGAWLRYDFATTKVKKVQMLNRGDCCG